MALQEAVDRGRLQRNRVALTLPPRRDRAHCKMGWTLDEAQRFLAGVSAHRLHAAFHLSLVTGLRRGELLGLGGKTSTSRAFSSWSRSSSASSGAGRS